MLIQLNGSTLYSETYSLYVFSRSVVPTIQSAGKQGRGNFNHQGAQICLK